MANSVAFPVTSQVEILFRVKIAQLQLCQTRGYDLNLNEKRLLKLARVVERFREGLVLNQHEEQILRSFELEQKIWDGTINKAENEEYTELIDNLSGECKHECEAPCRYKCKEFSNFTSLFIKKSGEKSDNSIFSRISYQKLSGVIKKPRRSIKQKEASEEPEVRYYSKNDAEGNPTEVCVVTFTRINPNEKSQGVDMDSIIARASEFINDEWSDIQVVFLIITPYKFGPSQLKVINTLVGHKRIIQIYSWPEILCNPNLHTLTPEFRLLSKEETEAKLKEINADQKQVPILRKTDPVVKYNGFPVGHFVTFRRPNLINPESFETYRIYHRMIE